MSVHGTPVNNVLNPRALGGDEDPAALDRLFCIHRAYTRKHIHSARRAAGPNSRFRNGFSAVRGIYFTTILIASVGREDDCGGPDVPSGSTIYSTLTYERKREPFKTRRYTHKDQIADRVRSLWQAGVDCRICRTWNDARLRRRME